MSKGFSIELDDETDVQTKRTVRCKSCEHVTTDPAFAVQPHEHTFRNPGGYSFHVLCYSDAPGASDVGEATAEASWFPNHAWTFAVCSQCGIHLGWWYKGADRFAGLIATRLIR